MVVLVPVATWEALLTSWKRLIERLEDEEDRAILREWLEKRASGEAETIPLDELERELSEARNELAKAEEKKESLGRERYERLFDQAKRRRMKP